jgi:HK97 family phage portal protein
MWPWKKPPQQEAKASAAGPLIALTRPAQPVWTPRDYAGFAREGYQKNPVVLRCVRMIAEAAASIPLRAPGHPAEAPLARPNPEQTGVELLEIFFGHLQVAANAYMELADLGGAPRALYALRPDRMRIIPGAEGWPEAWDYSVAGRSHRYVRDAVSGLLPILRLKLFNSVDDHYGHAPLEAAASAVDIHNAGGAWNKALIDNAARPSGALVFTGRDGVDRLTDEQFGRLEAELASAHSGPAAAGRPLLLEGGLEWTLMSLTPADMDFLNARHAAAREIALAFGVPPMLLGIPGDNTYANYREANLAFWRQTVVPLARKAAAALSAWLGPRYGAPLALALDLDGAPALQGERDALWARLEAASFLDTDEKRALAGLAP